MSEPLKNSRIGVYSCTVTNGLVTKGKYIRGDYIGVFTWDDLISRIIPDLRQYRLEVSQYPVLITSWQLQVVDRPKPARTPVGQHKLTSTGLRDLKAMLDMPVRKKNPRTETWEAVVDSTGRAFKVIDQRITY